MMIQPFPTQELNVETTYEAHIKRIRVVTMVEGTRFYVEITRELLFDPGRWYWDFVGSMISYTTRLGRITLNPYRQLTKSNSDKYLESCRHNISFPGKMYGTNINHIKKPPSYGTFFTVQW